MLKMLYDILMLLEVRNMLCSFTLISLLYYFLGMGFLSDLEPGSCYIARYDDRLMFIRIVSSGWKFLYAQVKGLEIQEQTSCHHQVCIIILNDIF